ncbi:modifier of protein aggregation 4 isoform X1 [Cryptotermes secundus]|uniref:modifier of protein aggregation 4 isoform X1 n=1 Tax=Cryptotermes secundus TaxID=105785 RepID=UPI001454BC56|nr:modifier of protein aggregation 4 isoform X1 [Cryptotermes secundus]
MFGVASVLNLFHIGGNQRELARQKNQKKQQEQQKRKSSNDKDSNKGLTLEQRKQRHVSGRNARDADLMRQKQMKAQNKDQAAAS